MKPNPDPYQELDGAEASAREHQQPVLALFEPVFGACDQTLRAYAEVLEGRVTADQNSSPALVHRVLLPRLADDLRSIWLLASRGYWMQAMALAASALEIAATVGFIGFRTDRATKWRGWESFKSAWPVRTLVEGTVTHWKGAPDSGATEDWMRWYTVFCWAKHANPAFQARALASLTPAGHVIGVMPDVTPKVPMRLWITLYSGVQVAVLALASLLAQDTTPPQAVTAAANKLFAQMSDLVDSAGDDGASVGA